MKLKFLLLILSFLIFACETNKEEDMEEAQIIIALNKIFVNDSTILLHKSRSSIYQKFESTIYLYNIK